MDLKIFTYILFISILLPKTNATSLFTQVQSTVKEFSGLSHDQFKQEIFNSPKPWFVILYSNFCGNSIYLANKLVPIFEGMENNNGPFIEDHLLKNVNFASVNCLEVTFCQDYYYVENNLIHWPQVKVVGAGWDATVSGGLQEIKSQNLYTNYEPLSRNWISEKIQSVTNVK